MRFFSPRIQSLTELVQTFASTVTSFFKAFHSLTVHCIVMSVASAHIDASELSYQKKQWTHSHLSLPHYLWFNRSLSYPPCGMSSVLEDPSTFGCLLSSSNSAAFIILVTLLQPFSISIISILEVGSEPDTGALWIYALIQSCSLFLSQWFLTFNLLVFFWQFCALSLGFHYLLYYLYYLSSFYITYNVLCRSSSWHNNELGASILCIKSKLLIAICVTLHLTTLNFIDHFITQRFFW